MRLSIFDNSNVCPIRHRLRDKHLWICQCIRFEFLTLKMTVIDVENLNENWATNVACQYVCAHKSALLGPEIVRSAFCSVINVSVHSVLFLVLESKTGLLDRPIRHFNYSRPSACLKVAGAHVCSEVERTAYKVSRRGEERKQNTPNVDRATGKK